MIFSNQVFDNVLTFLKKM